MLYAYSGLFGGGGVILIFAYSLGGVETVCVGRTCKL